jgi:hypothetical protein
MLDSAALVIFGVNHARFQVWLSYGDAMTMRTSQGSSRGEQITALPHGSQIINGKMSYSALTRRFHTALRAAAYITRPNGTNEPS